MITINKKKILYMAAFLLGGCINAKNVASEINNEVDSPTKNLAPKACKIPADAFVKLPTEVLDGTDLVDIGSFKVSSLSGSHFHTEMGGASLAIDIKTLNDFYHLERTYKEPGLTAMTSKYENVCVKAGHLYGKNIRGMFTENGILLLELKPDLEFISPDMWVYLEKN